MLEKKKPEDQTWNTVTEEEKKKKNVTIENSIFQILKFCVIQVYIAIWG